MSEQSKHTPGRMCDWHSDESPVWILPKEHCPKCGGTGKLPERRKGEEHIEGKFWMDTSLGIAVHRHDRRDPQATRKLKPPSPGIPPGPRPC